MGIIDVALRSRITEAVSNALQPLAHVLAGCVQLPTWKYQRAYRCRTPWEHPPVVRMRYCPARWDFGMRYLDRDLPCPVYDELRRIMFVGESVFSHLRSRIQMVI